MSGSSLKRLGLWILGVALVGIAATPILTFDMTELTPLLRHAALAGAAILAAGFLLDLAAGSSRKCPRCGRHSAKGSVFCVTHRQELTRAAHDVAVQHGRDNRGW